LPRPPDQARERRHQPWRAKVWQVKCIFLAQLGLTTWLTGRGLVLGAFRHSRGDEGGSTRHIRPMNRK
jgi:predicted anti-sigma-YlaC factor YlaD